MMTTTHQFLSQFLSAQVRARRDERGASLVEYALLVALIAIVCVAAVATLGNTTGDAFSSITTGF